MSIEESIPHQHIVARRGQPLVAIPTIESDNEVSTTYFADTGAGRLFVTDEDVDEALQLAGSLGHLSWEEMADALDRIRHESVPSLPINP